MTMVRIFFEVLHQRGNAVELGHYDPPLELDGPLLELDNEMGRLLGCCFRSS